MAQPGAESAPAAASTYLATQKEGRATSQASGRRSILIAPPARPSPMDRGINGTTSRLAGAAVSETSPKLPATSGTVASCAARVMEKSACTFPPPGLMASDSGSVNSTMPRMEAKESWKLRLCSQAGSQKSMAMSEAPTAESMWKSPAVTKARKARGTATAARTIGAFPPITRTYITTRAMAAG